MKWTINSGYYEIVKAFNPYTYMCPAPHTNLQHNPWIHQKFITITNTYLPPIFSLVH